MKTKTLTRRIVVGLCGFGLLPLGAYASVFDDAAFWFDGARLGENLRDLSAGDVPDVRKVGNANDPLNQSACVKGNAPKIVVETVTNAVTGASAEQGVVRFNQQITKVVRDDAGNVTSVEAEKFQSFDVPGVVEGTSYTVLMRFRPEKGVGLEAAELLGKTAQHTDNLFCIGNYKSNNDPFESNVGILLGLRVLNPAENADGCLGNLYVTAANFGYNHNLTDLGTLTAGQWYDLAFTVRADKSIRVGLGQAGGAMAYVNQTPNSGKEWVAGTSGEKLPLRVGFAYNNGWSGAVDPTKAWFANFKGSVATLAVWNRALGDSEVKEALGLQFPQTAPDVLRVGLDDGAADEFMGTAASAVVAADVPSSWRNFPATFDQDGQMVSIGFSVSDRADYLAGLPQLLTVKPSHGSGILRVGLGAFSSDIALEAGQTSAVHIPGSHFTTGDLSLVLTRVSGSFSLDSVALGGSWQIGYADSKHAEFGDAYAKANHDYSLATGDFTGAAGSLVGTARAEAALRLRFPVSAFAAANCRHVFRYANSQVVGAKSAELDVYVNDQLMGASVAVTDKGTFSMRLKPGVLVAGENSIVLSNRVAAASFVNHDAFSLEILRPSRGLVFLIR